MRTNNTKAANQVKPILKILSIPALIRTTIQGLSTKSAGILILAILIQTIAFNACSSGGDDPNDNGGDGGVWYDPNYENSRCQNGVVENKCGDVWYNTATHRCSASIDDNGNVNYTVLTIEQYIDLFVQNDGYERCGNNVWYVYNNENTRCQNGVLEGKCVDVWYNIATHRCSDSIDDNGNVNYTVLTWEQFYEQNGYVRCGR